jgi:hypothetical protein
MKIYIPQPLHWFENIEKLQHVVICNNPKKADVIIRRTTWDPTSPAFQTTTKHINIMDFVRGAPLKGRDRRTGYYVDDKRSLPHVMSMTFTQNDLSDPNIIIVPVDFNIPHTISQPALYWQHQPKMTQFEHHNRVYWKGSLANHESRETVFNYFKNKSKTYSVNPFEYRIYQKGGHAPSSVYIDYIKQIQQSDMVFNLRGDRPSTHSFFDIIQNGCIPININCMDDLGWENIMVNPNDYMLNFDLRVHSLDHIHTEIMNVLQDRDRVSRMKRNCVELFETVFKNLSFPWSEFILAKCFEIYKNNFDTALVSNKLICKEYLEIKGIDKMGFSE